MDDRERRASTKASLSHLVGFQWADPPQGGSSPPETQGLAPARDNGQSSQFSSQ